MPYITRWEKSRKEWMTLTEATHYIIEKESCEVPLALQQLFLAIVDGEVLVKRGGVHPDFTLGISPSEFQSALKICLKDEGSVKIDRDNKRFVIDPDSKKRRLNIIIVRASDFRSDDDDDWAGDDTAGENPFDYEPLWLRRDDVMRLWWGDASPTINHQARSVESRKQRTRPAPIEEIREDAREIYKEGSPNILIAEKRIKEKRPNTPRALIRSVLKEDEFARLRRPRGHQFKR